MSAAAALRAEAYRLEDYAVELSRYIDASHHHWVALAISGAAADAARGTLHSATDAPVSYTHLTLPTTPYV